MLRKSLLILMFGIAVINKSAALSEPLSSHPQTGLGGPPRCARHRFASSVPQTRLAGPMRIEVIMTPRPSCEDRAHQKEGVLMAKIDLARRDQIGTAICAPQMRAVGPL